MNGAAELRKDFVKRAPLAVGEVAAPIKSYAPPPANMQQANAAKGEGKVLLLLLHAVVIPIQAPNFV